MASDLAEVQLRLLARTVLHPAVGFRLAAAVAAHLPLDRLVRGVELLVVAQILIDLHRR
jgi:hypothetical protein